ncbi:hypothetical protein LZ30DRAFT_740511 [Colletotrichum cereale]|nr:hypothetical protein LZ30DRAFT_740511 [Colletotrichum cereale]
MEWRLMEEERWNLRIEKPPPQGPQPSAFSDEGADDQGEYRLHGFVDPAGTVWFVKLYEAEGWLFRGDWDSESRASGWLRGDWGRNSRVWFGSFEMMKMPF